MSASAGVRVAFRGLIGAFMLDAAFDAPASGVTALFGPSGCGKTSVLRCVAGLQRLAHGFCAVDGEIWQDAVRFQPPHARAIGYVFQEASLFPHLSVRGNLLFGAPRAPARAGARYDETVDLLGLGALLTRSPRHLSGGERQRVAIGRALLSDPKLLLMDEPMAALDRDAREEILPFLERLRDRLALPMLYVSHDMLEVERLADHLVLMEAGRVVASGPLQSLQADPTLRLARARDAAVSLDCVVESYDERYGLLSLAVEGGRLLAPSPPMARGERRRLRVEAGDVSLARGPLGASTILNGLACRILIATPIGPHVVVATLGLGREGVGARLLARITRKSWDELDLREGDAAWAQVKSVALDQSGGPAGD